MLLLSQAVIVFAVVITKSNVLDIHDRVPLMEFFIR
jgi:hypothetical protein